MKDGEDGKDGKDGKDGAATSYLGRKQTLALFAFVVLAFLLLAVRSEINSNEIRHGVYEVCMLKADVDNVRSDCERFR